MGSYDMIELSVSASYSECDVTCIPEISASVGFILA